MIYYKDDVSGEVYAYPASDVAGGLVQEGLRAMSEAEVSAHLNPVALYWTNGSALVLSPYGATGWWQASNIEVDALLPLLKAQDAEQEALRLRRVADSAIAPLQDAVDLEEATEAEAAKLKAWKKYRIALIRVPDQPGYPDTIDWPAPPA